MSEIPVEEQLQRAIRDVRRGAKEQAITGLRQVLMADPKNEEAWMWMARVMDSPQQRRQCLTRVLEINPQNRWAAEQMAALDQPAAAAAPSEGGAAPAASAPPPATDSAPSAIPTAGKLKVKLFNCPSCGGSLDLRGGEGIRTLACSYCGSVIDLTGETAAVLGTTAVSYHPLQPIELGMEADINDSHCQVIGWLRYEGWDDEDRWVWDEWLLASDKGGYFWLSYDSEDGFLIQRKVAITESFSPRSGGQIPVPGGSATITERNLARVVAIKGELTWRGKVGDSFTYLEAQRGLHRYSVELNAQEIEMFEGRKLTPTQVWRAFGKQELQKAAEKGEAERGYIRQASYVCWAFAAVGLLAAIGSSIPGRTLLDQSVQLTQGGTPAVVGPIKVTDVNRPYEITVMTSGLPRNSWAEIDVSITSPDDLDFDLFVSEVWDEEGRDDEGYWHENDLQNSYTFRPEDPGEYFLEVGFDETAVGSLPVRVKVRGAVFMSLYLFLFTGFAVLAALFFSWYSMEPRTRAGIVSRIRESADD